MIKNVVAKLLPKEDKFYKFIGDLAEQSYQAATHLKAFVESKTDAEQKKAVESIGACRKESKRISTLITAELCASFITPFDREDIQDFSYSLYKIIKTTKKICDRMQINNLLSIKQSFAPQVDLIVLEAEAMKEMVHELIVGHNEKRIVAKVDTLYELEQKGDGILSELLTTLFRDENDVKALILRKDIYDMLEKIIDRYRNAGAVALQIVLKHS